MAVDWVPEILFQRPWVALVLVANVLVVLVYSASIYYIFRGKVKLTSHSY